MKRLLFTLLIVFIQGQMFAQTTPVGLDFFTKVKMLGNLKEHNDNIYFTIRQADLESNAYNTDLYQLKEGKAIALTSCHNIGNYYIMEDGSILFSNVRDGKDKEKVAQGEKLTVIQRLTYGIGEATEWIRLPFSIGQMEFIDARHFFFTARYDNTFEERVKAHDGNQAEALKEQKEEAPYRIFEEIPFWSNGGGDTSGKRNHLYYYNDGEIKAFSTEWDNIGNLKLSPNKQTLLYTQSNWKGKSPLTNHLMKMNVRSLSAQEIHPLKQEAGFGGISFINENEILLTIRTNPNIIANGVFYRMNLTGDKEATLLYNGNPYGMGNTIGSDVKAGGRGEIYQTKEGFYYVTTAHDHAPIAFFDYKKGNVTLFTDEKATILDYLPTKDGFLAIAMKGNTANEIYSINKKGILSPISQINSDLLKEFTLSTPEEFHFTNEKGVDIEGWIMKPTDYQTGKKYPTILDIHGGPKTAFGPILFHEMQYWANNGYAVIFCNPTGSDGGGNEFANIHAAYGETDYRDIMKFVDTAIERYSFINADKMGVTGGSYGGFMTNWIIGHTNRFKAAASQRSIASWISFSNTTDIGYTFIHSQIGGDVWTNHDLLWKQSPLKYANQAKTPTLFIHSDEDYRCWMSEGIQMFYALKYFDVPARLCLFHNENHELSRSGKPKNRIKRLKEITNWMDKYLK